MNNIERDLTRAAELAAMADARPDDDYEAIVAQCDAEKIWRGVRRRTSRGRRALRISAVAASAVAVVALSLALLRQTEPPVIAPGEARATISLLGDNTRRDFALDATEQERGWQKYVAQTETASPDEDVMVRVSVPRGGEYRLTLNDGTRVWLNSETTIEYPERFSAARTVSLSGEAFFDVARDAEHPFLVETRGQTVRVVGTTFNISAYESDAQTVTTLVSGNVKLKTATGIVSLEPGRQAIFDGAAVTVRQVDTRAFASWTTGVFEFESMRLSDICTRLERWYNVSFTFEGDAGEERFTGGTWKYEPLDYLLEAIELATEVSFDRHGDHIMVHSRKN
jgi:ferric-dicitrate binding protein FerR (iron transport regulator)